jgi:hypothetical protein
MAQRVRRDVFSDAGARAGFGDDAHNVVIIEWTAGTRRDKESYLAGFMSKQRAGFFQIEFQSSDCRLRKRNYTLCVAFAVFDSECGGLQVNVVDR